MARSEEFEKNSDKVVAIVDAIPPGRCTTYGAVGDAIGIVARYVALIMATGEDVHTSPWWRVVSAGGVLRTRHKNDHRRHLEAEGVKFKGDKILDFAARFYDPLAD